MRKIKWFGIFGQFRNVLILRKQKEKPFKQVTYLLICYKSNFELNSQIDV